MKNKDPAGNNQVWRVKLAVLPLQLTIVSLLGWKIQNTDRISNKVTIHMVLTVSNRNAKDLLTSRSTLYSQKSLYTFFRSSLRYLGNISLFARV